MENLRKDEVFQPIPRTFEAYHISNYGRVLSSETLKFLGIQQTPSGKPKVVLTKHGKRSLMVFPLVADTFTLRPSTGHVAVPKDGIWMNAVNSNIKWVEKGQEVLYSQIKRGEQVTSSKLTEQDVRDIWQMHYGEGLTIPQIINILDIPGIAQQTISDILNRKSWKHIQFRLKNT